MAGKWIALVNQPKFEASTMLLMTDGTVLCQEAGGTAWWRLAPDSAGDYIAGSWTAVAPMHHTRLYYASAMLMDGRVLVAGGEYSSAGNETNTAEIYDPSTDTWSEINPPDGWMRIGDAPCVVLPDGRLLLGQIDDPRTALYDPSTGVWTTGPNKGDRSSEESWVLMPDGSVVTVQCSAHPGSEKYLPSSNRWVATPNTPDDLVEAASIETGAGVLLPDGRALFIGATPFTALYTSGPNPDAPGTWTRGPAIPKDAKGTACGAKDAPACLMPNGHVLVTVGPVNGISRDYLGPTYFYEFDGKSFQRITDAPNAGIVPYVGRMLLLPSGDVLYAGQTQALYAYRPAGGFSDAWRPKIVAAPTHVMAGASHTLSGTQFNGLSQAVGYGDDAAGATNYPLVRLAAADGNIVYCRTFGHSSMGVATGTTVQTTSFLVPSTLASGDYELTVVANGIPSPSVSVRVGPLIAREWSAEWDRVIADLSVGKPWAIGPNGPVPVDPWGRKHRAEARAATRAIIKATKTLQRIGARLDRSRAVVARATEPASDPELERLIGKTKAKKRRPKSRKAPPVPASP